MSNYPKLIELYESILTDSYAFLLMYSSDETKASIEVLREDYKNDPEIIKMSYVLLCSFSNAYKNLNKNILDFTKTYIEDIYNNLIYEKKDIYALSNINDCCEGYISLFGYRYIFEGVFDNEYLAFTPKYYETYYNLLNKYNILEEIQNYYENTLDNLFKIQNNEIASNFFDLFVKYFQKNYLGYQKDEKAHTNSIESTGKENNGTPQTSNTDIQINEIGENGNQNIQINSSVEIKAEEKNSEIEVFKSMDKISENIIKKLEKELLTKLNNKMLLFFAFSNIENSYEKIMIFEKIVLDSEFNLTIINIEQKKNEYLDNVIKSLENIIRNLANPYNFNLWRKLTNIILKNIFVILHKKKFELFQYYNYSVLNQLNIYRKYFPEKRKKEGNNSKKKNDEKNKEKKKEERKENKKEEVKDEKEKKKDEEKKGKKDEEKKEEEKNISYNNKLISYENELNKQKLNIKSSQTSAADKPRNYNIIVVKNNVKYSLCIDFLFYLKEKGNKMDHFDQEIIDLILFEDLNIKLINNGETCNQEENKKETENKIENENKEISYDGKINFTGEEILEMLKNPLKYHKQEIDLNKIYECVYNKIKEIKSLDGYIKNNKTISDLKNDIIKLEKKIEDLIISFENYFLENNINYKSAKENENLDNYQKDYIQKYTELKEIKKKTNNKIKDYEKLEKELISLSDIKDETNKKIDKIINEIKNENIRKNEIISISDIFNEFKEDLKEKIKTEEEYKSYSDIFNENNINDYKIEDLYSFLKENLNYPNAMFSIVKKDVTNYNFLVEVITKFNELKDHVYNKDLDVKI